MWILMKTAVRRARNGVKERGWRRNEHVKVGLAGKTTPKRGFPRRRPKFSPGWSAVQTLSLEMDEKDESTLDFKAERLQERAAPVLTDTQKKKQSYLGNHGDLYQHLAGGFDGVRAAFPSSPLHSRLITKRAAGAPSIPDDPDWTMNARKKSSAGSIVSSEEPPETSPTSGTGAADPRPRGGPGGFPSFTGRQQGKTLPITAKHVSEVKQQRSQSLSCHFHPAHKLFKPPQTATRR